MEQEIDCGFTRDGHWFRYRAAAIIIEEGCALFVRNEKDPYFYAVGGGVHTGETAEDAVRREVWEETGTHYEIDRLAVLHENFFPGNGVLEGLACHELALYFMMKPKGSRSHVKSGSSTTQGVPEHLHWLPLAELSRQRAYPTWLAEYLACPGDGVRHIVTRE